MNPLLIVFCVLIGVAALFGAVVLSCVIVWLLAESSAAIARAQAATDFRNLYRRLAGALQRSKQPASDDAPEPVIVVLGRDVLAQTQFLQAIVNGEVVFTSNRAAARKMLSNDTMALAAHMRLMEKHGLTDVFVLHAKSE